MGVACGCGYLSEVEEEAGVLSSLRDVGEEDNDGEPKQSNVHPSLTQ